MRVPAQSANHISNQNKIRTGILTTLPDKLDNVALRGIFHGLPPVVRAGNFYV
jgi:hypothetical protein